MTDLRALRATALAIFAIFLWGCSGPNVEGLCPVGETRVCPCDETLDGIQYCLAEGQGWGDCECAWPDGDADADSDAELEEDGDLDIDADPEPEHVWDLEPDRPHRDIEHLTDRSLIKALSARVADHEGMGYEDARDHIFTELDVRGGLIECVYTGRKVRPDGTHQPDGFNTEHSWPRSDGADREPAESDLHHLFPSDADANSRRGSHPFGDTSCTGAANDCTWDEGGSELGMVQGGRVRVFEVRPESRGDIARAHFYFSVRYDLPIPATEEVFLRRWNYQDLPTAVERDRNDDIERAQSNRNPFVDRPDFVDQIADF